MGSLFQLLLRTFCCFTALFPNHTVLRLIRLPFVLRMYILVSVRAMLELFGQSPVCDTGLYFLLLKHDMSCTWTASYRKDRAQPEKDIVPSNWTCRRENLPH